MINSNDANTQIEIFEYISVNNQPNSDVDYQTVTDLATSLNNSIRGENEIFIGELETGTLEKGIPSENSNRARSVDFISFNYGIIKICNNTNLTNQYICCYNNSKVFIGGFNLEIGEHSYKVIDSTSYIKFIVGNNQTGSTLSLYESLKVYGIKKITTFNNEALYQARKTQSPNSYPCLSLLHFSDIHGDTDRLKRIIRFFNENNNIITLNEQIQKIDKIPL